MDNNLPLAKKYFAENGWDLQELLKMTLTKHTKYNEYYLGNEKNTEGMCINCNGVMIDAYGELYIKCIIICRIGYVYS